MVTTGEKVGMITHKSDISVSTLKLSLSYLCDSGRESLSQDPQFPLLQREPTSLLL